MAYHCSLQEKRQFPIMIGNCTFYAEHYQLTGIRQFTEQTLISGTPVFTNHSIRARRLCLDGRFLRTDPMAVVLLQLDLYLKENISFSIEIDGIHYAMCQLSRYIVQEDGHSAALTCRLECIVTNPLSAAISNEPSTS